MTPVIKVDNLKMGYGDRVIMECLDFEINQGEIFIILGDFVRLHLRLLLLANP